MATWRAENSMLTEKGVEILNKIKAGVGSITVTRVVAGSGRVAESQLINMSQVSGNTKSMVLSRTSALESGTEISIYITNSDFTEPFDLNQIGVYVTHPDYNEEQLYHISQCDAEGFDVIPAFDETPVTFGYSLFLEHGNSSSISITVDPQGMVALPEFEEYRVSVENRITYLQYKIMDLEYSDVGAAPYGLIYDHKIINQASGFPTTILEWFNSIGVAQTRNFILNVNVHGAPLEGGIWSVNISRVNDTFGTIIATKYSEYATDGGIIIKTCSIHNSSLTTWKSILHDGVVPASVE